MGRGTEEREKEGEREGKEMVGEGGREGRESKNLNEGKKGQK